MVGAREQGKPYILSVQQVNSGPSEHSWEFAAWPTRALRSGRALAVKPHCFYVSTRLGLNGPAPAARHSRIGSKRPECGAYLAPSCSRTTRIVDRAICKSIKKLRFLI